MNNPYEEQQFQPYTPDSYIPQPHCEDGNRNFASVSLTMGILSILSICCFPPLLFLFAGLGILFSCLSKGKCGRPGPAKAGMAIGVSGIVIMIAMIILSIVLMLFSPMGDIFSDYFELITSDETTTEDIYEFLDKYLSDEELENYKQMLPEGILPDESEMPDGNFL